MNLAKMTLKKSDEIFLSCKLYLFISFFILSFFSTVLCRSIEGSAEIVPIDNQELESIFVTRMINPKRADNNYNPTLLSRYGRSGSAVSKKFLLNKNKNL